MKMNLSIIEQNGCFGIADGDMDIVDAVYSNITYIAKAGSFIVEKDGKFGLIDRVGKVRMDCCYSEIRFLFDGKYSVEKKSQGINNTGVTDIDGNKIIDFVYENIEAVDDLYFRCRKAGIGNEYDDENRNHPFWHNKDGKFIFNGYAHSLSDKFIVQRNENHLLTIWRNDGYKLSYEQYQGIKETPMNTFVVVNNDKLGMIDFEGKTLFEADYDFIESSNVKNDKSGNLTPYKTLSELRNKYGYHYAWDFYFNERPFDTKNRRAVSYGTIATRIRKKNINFYSTFNINTILS